MGGQVTTEQLAALVTKMEPVFEGDTSLKTLDSRIKAADSVIEGLKTKLAEQGVKLGEQEKLDLKQVREDVDKIKASQESMRHSIKHFKGGIGFFPGVEDTGAKFSLIRAMTAARTNNWDKAGHEREVMDAAKKAAQQMGHDNLGGYFVPDQTIPDVIDAIYRDSVFVNLQGTTGKTSVSVIDGLVGGSVKIPKFQGGCVAYWIGEVDPYTKSNVTVAEINLNPKKLGVLVVISESMRQFGSFGFEARLRQDMIQALAIELDRTIAYGKGTANEPRGILAHDAIKVYRSENKTVYATPALARAAANWLGGALDFDGLMNMQGALDDADIKRNGSFKWISSPAYFRWLRQLKNLNFSGQTTGQPYVIMPMLPDARLAELIGPFLTTTGIPANDKAGASIGATASGAGLDLKHTTVFGGNLSEVLLGRWGGLVIDDDGGKGIGYTSDQIHMKVRMLADIGIREEKAIVVCPDARIAA